MIEIINEEIKSAPETIFDTFKIKIDARAGGQYIRDQLPILVDMYGSINKLATNALFLHERAKARYDKVESLAWAASTEYSLKATQLKMAVREIKVVVDGETTCLNDEAQRLSTYEYVASRGKDKIKEIASAIDIGRSLLSWEKMAAEKGM